MQPPRDETLRTLLGDLYPNDSFRDGKELSSQLLQIFSQAYILIGASSFLENMW